MLVVGHPSPESFRRLPVLVHLGRGWGEGPGAKGRARVGGEGCVCAMRQALQAFKIKDFSLSCGEERGAGEVEQWG